MSGSLLSGGPAGLRPRFAHFLTSNPAFGESRAAAKDVLLRVAGPKEIPEIQALSRENDPTFFWNGFIEFAARLRASGRPEAASAILSWMTQTDRAIPEPVQAKARSESAALLGRGSFGQHGEVLLQRFRQEVLDPKLIAPMILGSAVFQLSRGVALGRLAGSAEGLLTRGLGARLSAGVLGFAAEVPAFTLANRALHAVAGAGPAGADRSLGEDLLGAALTLGALRSFSVLGSQSYWGAQRILGLATGGGALGRQIFSQAAVFAGLLTARRLEVRAGLRPAGDHPFEVADTLATMLSLSVGLRAGRHLLGPRFTAWEGEMERQAQSFNAGLSRPRSGGLALSPAWAQSGSASVPRAPMLERLGRELNVHMSSHGEGGPADTGLPLPTYPQTTARNLPKFQVLTGDEFEAADGNDRQQVANFERSRQILTEGSGLSPLDRNLYARFVLDRVPDYPALLRFFEPHASTRDLPEALHWFAERFGDETESGLPFLLQSTGIVPSGASAERPLNYELLILMRTAKADAAYYLDRLNQPLEKAHLDLWEEMQPDFPELNEEVLRTAYRHMVRERIFTQKIYQHYLKDEFAFAVTDAGHEVHGAAAAYALHHEVNPAAFAISPHYRSGTLVGLWSELQGYDGYYRDYIRQQISRASDPWSKGRQTASHFNDLDRNILPAHSEVGRNLSVAVGYARALQQQGHRDAVVYAEFGDGSMALSDFHEAMTGATVMGHNTRNLPVVIGVLDNQMAISVEPASGRALSDLAAYARAFGAKFYTCDGNDFIDVYQTYRVAVSTARGRQMPVLIWVQNLPRLNNHSSAAQFNFDFKQRDPLLELGEAMVKQGLLNEADILQRNVTVSSPNFFGNHILGEIGEAAKRSLDQTWSEVAQEPEPSLSQTLEDVRLPFPEVQEASPENRPTAVIINGAIRAALRDIIEENPLTWVNGQDTGMKGGVMQATAGLWELFPRNVTDAPINEPAIVGIGLGFALHPGAIAFPEIQFGDYSTSALHWMIKAGNLLWTSGGSRRVNFNLRLPVEPGIGGAVYHSTPLEGLYAAIPGLTIVAPSTSRDAYGLIRSAAEYAGPVLIFEPKAIYRRASGDAFPNEPRDDAGAQLFTKDISLRRGIPDLPKDFRVPLGKAAVRREGKDLTIVTWGLAHYEALNVLNEMVAKGIDVELIDLRTLVPPDMATVLKSVDKTGRLLVAHQDRVFSSLGREIQGQVHEALPDRAIRTRVLGMEPVPGIPQHRAREHDVMVTGKKILAEALRMVEKEP